MEFNVPDLITCTKIIRAADKNWVQLFETKVVKKIKIVNDKSCSNKT